MRRVALLLLFWLTPAFADEHLVSGLSQDTIEIRANYNGAEITVFGAVERPDTEKPNVIVVVRGQEQDMRVLRKERVAGIWINRSRVLLRAMPSYYFVAGNRPLDRIAARDVRSRYAFGLDAVKPHGLKADDQPEPFREALIARMQRDRLYVQQEDGVEFLSGTLFRVRVPVPSTAPRGTYVADVYLLRDGKVVDTKSSDLVIDQIGVERQLYDFSRSRPLLYGVATVLIAMLLGWASSLMFRRAE
ncbi:MAG TPA: TIGR02186 family protein [Rhizomicrobium sp.]|nr:TIGR02186 family protein [Rhizomicrobium sp.]